MTPAEGEPSRRRDEIEVKIPCEDLGRTGDRLRDLGASSRSPRHFESNVLYDDADGRLAASGRALRLRVAGGQTLLTFKGPAHFSQGIKIREEREVVVSDASQTEAILVHLGLAPRFRYEKWREEWTLEGCTVALDETPIGTFVEVEGDPAVIRRVVAALELDFSQAVPYTYAKLYSEKRKADPKLPSDMIFGS